MPFPTNHLERMKIHFFMMPVMLVEVAEDKLIKIINISHSTIVTT